MMTHSKSMQSTILAFFYHRKNENRREQIHENIITKTVNISKTASLQIAKLSKFQRTVPSTSRPSGSLLAEMCTFKRTNPLIKKHVDF